MTHRLAPLAGLVALGALLRFATLDARSYWLDEVLTVDILEEGFGGTLSRLGEPGGGGPVYFFLAWPWAQVFGTSEVALRSLSALFGTATVPVAYWAVRELASRRAGLIAAALAATGPLLVWQSQEARPYALLVLLGGVSFALFLRARRAPRAAPRLLGRWRPPSWWPRITWRSSWSPSRLCCWFGSTPGGASA